MLARRLTKLVPLISQGTRFSCSRQVNHIASRAFFSWFKRGESPADQPPNKKYTREEAEQQFLSLCQQNDLGKLRQLILDVKSHKHFTVANYLVMAAESGNRAVVDAMMGTVEGINIGLALYDAGRNKPVSVLELLLERGGEPYAPRGLLGACAGGNLEVVKFLLDRGLDINEDKYRVTRESSWSCHTLVEERNTPLKSAISSGSLELVKFLLDKGANFKAHYAFQFAAISGRWEIVELFLDRGLDVNDLSGGVSALYAASCREESLEVVKKLLERGAEVDRGIYKDGTGCDTPLMTACWCGCLEIAKTLLDYGADINHIGSTAAKGCTPLHWAADEQNKIEVLKLLIVRGASINAPNATGHTPLDVAKSQNNTLGIKILFEHGGFSMVF